jgi:hypothetical protein
VISANFIARFYIRLKQAYGLDIRALSLMRIALALVLLFDLCIRASSLTAHYTETGAVPFKAVELAFWKPGYFSLFEFSDTYGFAVFIFCLTGITYLFLLAGYKTRLFTLLSWLLLISLQNRNTLILQGGDDMLRLLLFWGIFLPWGNYYSVDCKMAQAQPVLKEKKVLSMATLGYVLLLASAYFFTGLLKNASEWTSEGTAIYYTLSLDQMVWPLGKLLLQHTTLLKYLTLFIRWFEILMPLLLFIPFKNARFRMIFVLGITAFQIGIALTLFVGLFYLICLVSLIGLLPSFMLNKFDRLIKHRQITQRKNHIKSLMQKLQENYYLKVILNCFLFFCIALSMLWNVSTVQGSGLTVSDHFYTFGYSLRFNQSWGMFAPSVLKDDGWYVLEGTTADSLKIDINRNGAKADYSKPALALTYIKDDRWRKFLENYIFTYNAFIRPYYCNYILKEWNTEHPEKKVVSLGVIYMKEISLPPGQKQTATREVLCRCVD